MMNRPRVLLAEDHQAAAEQLRSVLETAFEVVAVVTDGVALVEAAQALRSDAIVTDIAMAVLDGIAATTSILQQNPDARIVFVTVHGEAAIVQRGLAAGALGYVLKQAAGEDLVPAVHAALRGQRYVSLAASAGLSH
jgi:DNA-binding NarL/FixJ family response regulator